MTPGVSGASETEGHASPMPSRATPTVLSLGLFLASSEQLRVRGHAAALTESPL